MSDAIVGRPVKITTSSHSRALIRQLLTGQWLTSHNNLLVTGPTGVGKTFMVCALATATCRQGFQVRYYRMSRIFQDIVLAKGDGSYGRLTNYLIKVDLLILDDWGLAPIGVAESRELLDILVDLWYQHFADATLADAILDRLIHRAHRLKIQGDTMRRESISLPTGGNSGV